MTCSYWTNSLSLGDPKTGAIAGGVAAGAALVFAVPAIGFALWRRRKPEEHFFDVPGEYYIHNVLQFKLLISFICILLFTFSRGGSGSAPWPAEEVLT